MGTELPLGKLPNDILARLINNLPTDDPSIVIPPGIGKDAAGIRIGDNLISVTTDPITLATAKLGMFSVAVNVNDVACLGCRPRWYSAVLLLPPHINETLLAEIWDNINYELRRYNITAIGGHTEVTSSVTEPILVGQIIGEPIDNTLLDPANARVGDKILLWRDIAIEGTAVLANERYGYLLSYLGASALQRMQNLLNNPGICVLSLVEKLIPDPGVIALHDATEGGIATALHELADATKCGLDINGDTISILPETKTLAKLLNFNPLGLLASGSLIIICRATAEADILTKLHGEPITTIGTLTSNQERRITIDGQPLPLPRYTSDEIIKALTYQI